jgi:collagen type II alpha
MAGDDPSRLFAKLTDDDRKALVVKAYEQLKVSFDKYTKPSGDKAAPARTCRDLAVAHPELPSGDYWIDPNQGDTKDSILVFCEMNRRSTCIRPKPEKTKQITYLGKPRAEVWFSEMDSGFQVYQFICGPFIVRPLIFIFSSHLRSSLTNQTATK